MEESIKIANSLRKEVIWLGVWENNDRAVRFYSRWGFEKFSEHIFMLGDEPQTDWLMRRVLGESLRQASSQ
jgi:ribosomal protein S18 acetylase RimI-like enzyme